MAVATIGAIALGDYQEGTAVMLFYQIGELFQSYAVGKNRKLISELKQSVELLKNSNVADTSRWLW